MKIGIDLDEVLADFLAALIRFHNDHYGTSLVREQFKSYRFWETWGGTREQAVRKVYQFHKTHYFEDIRPVEGSQEAVRILSKRNDLVIITSRQDHVAKATRRWIDQHFPDIFSEVYFTNHYSQYGRSKTKKQVCDSAGVGLLIEDLEEFALECLTPGREVLLLDAPWNKNIRFHEGIHRVRSWEDITDHIRVRSDML